MITIVLTNRNRDLRIVNNCLNSLKLQTNTSFNCFLVDYGSNADYLILLQDMLDAFPEIKLISCPVSGQLWNKARAINIALQQTIKPYFLVADIDLIFSPYFFQKCFDLRNKNKIHYFQCGFLSEVESSLQKKYGDFNVDFIGYDEVTGITMFPTQKLKQLGGYDEFYHGWGAEDTDIHLRMENAGLKVSFYNQEILVKHQWHPKAYRSKNSQQPFQSQLERINHNYMDMSLQNKRKIANHRMGFGSLPIRSEYERLDQKADFNFHITNSQVAFEALLAQMANFTNETIQFKISSVPFSVVVKNHIKKILGKKYISFLTMENINNRLLLEIIKTYRNHPYKYAFARQQKIITLIIRF